jgi:hypothetical protein
MPAMDARRPNPHFIVDPIMTDDRPQPKCSMKAILNHMADRHPVPANSGGSCLAPASAHVVEMSVLRNAESVRPGPRSRGRGAQGVASVRQWVAAIGIGIVVVGASACGSAGSSTPTTTASPTTSAPTTTRPPAATTTVASAPVRTVLLGETFSIAVGETVSVPAQSLSVTYSALVSDNRCRPTQQCIAAGVAQIKVSITKTGMPPASLTLTTTDPPSTARYGRYTVTLVKLSFGQAPTASLKIT